MMFDRNALTTVAGLCEAGSSVASVAGSSIFAGVTDPVYKPAVAGSSVAGLCEAGGWAHRPRLQVLKLLLGIAVLGVVSLGCQREPSSSGSRAVNAVAPVDPEKSFAEIVRVVRDQMQPGDSNMPPGFIINRGGRRTQFVLRNDVTSELFAPVVPGEAYRGTITITSESVYSIRRTEDAAEKNGGAGGETGQENQQVNLFDDSESYDAGIEIIDSDLVSSSPLQGSPPTQPATIVNRQEDKDVSTFELAYENDRWVLKTEPDAETEQAIKRAFELAMSRQL